MRLCQTHVALEQMNQCYSLSRIKIIIFFYPKSNIPTHNFPTILNYSSTYFITKCKSYKLLKQYSLQMTCQLLNFIPTPSQKMNEIFNWSTMHDILQNEVQMLTMCPLATTTQRISHHCSKTQTCASWEIPNNHLVLLNRWGRSIGNFVNLPIPWWQDLCGRQNTDLQ